MMLPGEDLNRVISCMRNQSSLMCTLNWMLRVVLSAGLCRSLEDVVVHGRAQTSAVFAKRRSLYCAEVSRQPRVLRHELHVCFFECVVRV